MYGRPILYQTTKEIIHKVYQSISPPPWVACAMHTKEEPKEGEGSYSGIPGVGHQTYGTGGHAQ